MKTRSIRSSVRFATIALFLPSLLGGCGDAGELGDPEAVAGESSPINQAVLENALLNEGQFAEGGYALEGRAWIAPELSLSFYVGQDQTRIVSWLMRAGVELEPSEFLPEEGESFEAFVARRGAGAEHALEDVASTGPNVLLFDPSAPEFQSTNRLTAVGRNDYCPRSWFDGQCRLWAGIDHPQFQTWNLTDRTSSSSQSQTGLTGVMATGCADLGNVDFALSITNPRWGAIGGSFNVTVNQGNGFGNYAVAGWKQEEYCKTKVLGVCVDYAFRIKYQTFDARATLTPRSGAEGHYCGTFTKTPDRYVGDIACDRILTCPVQCPPGATHGACRDSHP